MNNADCNIVDDLNVISHRVKNQLSNAYKAEFDDISYEQCRILMSMYRNQNNTYNQNFLVKKLNKSKSLVTRWLTHLEAIGLISRNREGRDIYLSITHEGKRRCERLYEVQHLIESKLLKDLQDDAIVSLSSLLKCLIKGTESL
ncbi:MarR family transcriptional regulator [Vibrio sp. S4M6]|uniref:MarR family transcriptional regulator n=1 Tax=Vibrio sinus TaxID=2946865 RepID=UPI002029B41B|nr:MarR family transcriptional regulator [Vibrio sinus]MCL9781170.1 MarR family transcriptional regulator [Vibrio sinus]